MPAKRYFELSDGTSNKFWEVWRAGSQVYTRYGKIGATGQLTVKDLASDGEAKQQHDKLVKEKTGKGYVEGGGKAAKSAAKSNGKAAPAAEAAEVVIPPGAQRLELVEGKSAKFWQIQVEKKAVVVTFGKIGTPGTTEKTKYKQEWEVRHARDRLVEDKKKKGYQLVLRGKRPKVPAVAASNPQLEQAIMKDLASDDAFMVYADWLQQQGDVRGELAVLQARIASSPKDKKLKNAEAKQLWEYREHFFGPLAPYVIQKPGEYQAVDAIWRQGFIDKLTLSAVEGSGGEDESELASVGNVAELIRLLPKVSSARFLRELVIAAPVNDGEFDFSDAVKELVKVMPAMPTLRRLTIGKFTADHCELSWSNLGKAEALWPVAGKLEYLKIRAGLMGLGKLSLPELRELRIETGGLDKKSVTAIAAASWPKLETLNLWFGQSRYGGNCTVSDVVPFLDGKKFPKLRHLGIANTTFGDELAPLLAKAKIVRQLETLDISKSHLTAEGMRVLADHKNAFSHLSVLDVSRCLLDKDGVKLAQSLAKRVEVGHQDNAADYTGEDESDYNYRYSAVGE